MFKNLEKFDIRNAMSYVDLPELGKRARILLRPATEANAPYYNSMLAKSGKRVRRMVKTDQITAEDAALNRQEDRELYPLFVIAGWEFVEGDPDTAQEGELDEDGHVIFNRRHAQKLCAVLPDHLMDVMRNHASTPERFYPVDVEVPPDPAEVAENSESVSSSS